MSQNIKYRFKVVLLGDEAVGKTSLILRYINNSFTESYIPTLGVNFITKDLHLKEGIRLIVWDIGGQEIWKAKLDFYLKGADGAIIVCDLTRPATLTSIEDLWIPKLLQIAGSNTPFVLAGNKCDLKDLWKIKDNDIKKFLKKQKSSSYFKTSAKTGENVEKFFESISEQILKSKA